MKHLRYSIWALTCSLLLVACAKEGIVHDLEEREANEIMVLLEQHQVDAEKVKDTESGGNNKGARFMIEVSKSEATRASALLSEYELPRKKDAGYSEVFGQSGLVPTASEEKAKMMQAQTGDLTRTLKSIVGILDARVHIVTPEDSPLRMKEEERPLPSAGVWFKYIKQSGCVITDKEKCLPGGVTLENIAGLIANSVEKLQPGRVYIVAVPVSTEDLSGAGGGVLTTKIFFGAFNVATGDVMKLKGLIVGLLALVLIAIAAAVVIYSSMNNRLRQLAMSAAEDEMTGTTTVSQPDDFSGNS